MKKYAVLLMVLFIMGCTQQTNEEKKTISYNGVVITSLTPGIYSLMPDESTGLSMVLENKGDFEATIIETKLLGLGQMESEPIGEESRPKKMSPQDIEEFLWDLTAPVLSGFNSEVPFTIQGIVYFNYSTQSWSDAALVPSGSSSQPITENGTSSAPVSISLSTSPEVIRTYKENTPFSIKIEIINRGGGSIAYFEEGAENTEKSNYIKKITIRVPSEWEIIDSSDSWKMQSGTSNWKIYSKSMMDNELRLTGGSSKTIYVPFSMPDKVDTVKSQRFYVNATYAYKVSSNTATISVMPQSY